MLQPVFIDSPGFTRETHYKNIVHLWEFLLELLANENCRSIITWTSKDRWEFKVQNPQELAKKWGMFKKKNVMTYENLSRSLRYYYKQGIIKKVGKDQKLFCLNQVEIEEREKQETQRTLGTSYPTERVLLPQESNTRTSGFHPCTEPSSTA